MSLGNVIKLLSILKSLKMFLRKRLYMMPTNILKLDTSLNLDPTLLPIFL